ncbi:DUF732 domain-containing protein [Rhodococcus ruber]|uniref:Uncharacterized protein n=1 Tax=Rhodococcus ruber TaxID=1830 RepID=A0A098BGP9_9NOCA|nr:MULTISPECIES: DUF732 domain-containing protein [Rhodococcus]ATQ30388.1 DUF732 domain-containing protein [Rhodococcus ruber]AUM19457.1 DUF732 domain-containing protein [Rhodococcus ruber]AXY49969.1 hypothetical protein YT1_0512 [Rhodococcus ruber]MBD8056055.1 DUF732 domain-containing protein [Rhodococcus ruber]MCD2129007.1 DUF732 domain-containing protein [Rhodococcus ruber]
MPARTRSSLTRVLGAGAAALAATALLGACGSDDSTATNTPSTSVSATTSTSAAETTAAKATTTAPEGAATTSPGEAATAPPAQPETEPGFPGPAEVPVDDRGQAFLDGLRERGVEPAADGSIAINTANYICAATAQGSSPEEIKTIVTAAVGSEATAAGKEISDADAATTADVYITVARDTFC